MSAINPIRRNAGFHDASRHAAISNKGSNAEGGLNFKDVLAGVAGNDNSGSRTGVISGIPVISVLTLQKPGINPIRANAAYIRAGAENHNFGEKYRVPLGPAVYDFVSH